MIPPYKSRIVIRHGDGPWEELVRFTKQMFPHDLRAWTVGLSCEWNIETTLNDRQCISSRPNPQPPTKRRPRVMLRPEENEALEEAGLQPNYKL